MRYDVKCIIIGGYAVVFHGYSRTTADLDIWLDPDEPNKEKFLQALKEFNVEEQHLEQLQQLDFSKPAAFFLGEEPDRIDFLTQVSGLTFNEAFSAANHFPLDEFQVPVLQYHHLILSKISNDRLKDKADVEMLQKIRAKRGR